MSYMYCSGQLSLDTVTSYPKVLIFFLSHLPPVAQLETPFYEEWWFLIILALSGLILLLMVVFGLLFHGQSRRHKGSTGEDAPELTIVLTYSCTHSRSLTLSHSHSLTHTLSLSLSHSLTHSHSHSLTLTHTNG